MPIFTLIKKPWFLGILLGLIVAFSIFDLAFIIGTSAHWEKPFGDTITNFIGAMYFAQDTWRWPLFYVPSLAVPEGASIIYTDSIPLFALLDKLIFKIVGQWFNYFGLWIFLCFPLLGLFTGLAIREARCKDPLIIAGGVLLALTSPAFLIRFGHAGLMGHFLLAWSIFLYLKFINTASLRAFVSQFLIVAAVSILTQAYFLLMVMPFFVAGLLQSSFNRQIKIYQAVMGLVMVLAGIVFVAFLAGIIGSHSTNATAFGFGYYSMNALSPFVPPRAHLPNFIAQWIQWDGNYYTWDATGGQYEGYNYLGLGLIGLVSLVLFTGPKWICKKIFKDHIFLFLGMVVLTFLALSNHILLGNHLIFDHPFHAKLFAYFRTGGRLFWPVYYVLVVACVVILYRRFSPTKARVLLLLCVAIQLIDTRPLRDDIIAANRSAFPQKLSHEVWRSIIGSHQFIEQYPSFQCGGWAGGWPENNSNMELLWVAAQLNKPTNSAYLARTSRNCHDEKIRGMRFDIKKGGLYIYSKQFPLAGASASKNFKKWCREFSDGLICSQHLNSISEITAINGFAIPKSIPLSSYQYGERLQFVANGSGINALMQGWSINEAWGTWTEGKTSELILKLKKSASKEYLLGVRAMAFVHPNHPKRIVSVYLNDIKVADWDYHLRHEEAYKTLKFSKSILRKDGILIIRLVSKDPESPQHAGFSSDKRQISLGLKELVIKPVDA